ncbi:MAG: (2Fe-2S) ferredoxin domain-containing protein [Spirochaetales bacterium]
MARMTLDELRALRDTKRHDLARRDVEGKDIQIIVGMGTCGIAAGAKLTFDALVDSIQKHGLENRVLIRQTGCMGLCYVEPTVEVAFPGMPTVIYGKMTQDTAEELVQKHLVEHSLLDNHIFDRPAADIIAKSGDAGLRAAPKGGK